MTGPAAEYTGPVCRHVCATCGGCDRCCPGHGQAPAFSHDLAEVTPGDVLTSAEQRALPPGCQCSYALSQRDGRWHLITRDGCELHADHGPAAMRRFMREHPLSAPRQATRAGPVPLADMPGTPCPSGYVGCDHDLTVHSADLGCWLCDCTYGRPS